MRKYLLATFLFSLLWGAATFVAGPVSAAVLEKRISRTYNVGTEFVDVIERLEAEITDSQYFIQAGSEEVFVIFNPVQNDSKARDKIDRTIPTIKVTDDFGNSVQFTTSIEGQNILVRARYPQAIRKGSKQILRIQYRSHALLFKSGAVYDFYVPSFSKDYEFENAQVKNTIATQVLLPKALGEINFISPNSQPTDAGDKWDVKFSQAQLTGTVSWIQVGTVQYYEFDIRQPYQKTSTEGFLTNTYRITLPRDVTAGPFSQKAFFSKLSPEPLATEQDEHGNLIGVFKVPANVDGEIVIQGYIEVRDNRDFSIESAGNLADIPAELASEATLPATYWEVDSADIQSIASNIRGEETDVYKILTATYAFVVDRIDYSEVKRFGINERQGALATLKGGAAVCMEYSDLFIALMRAHGIPARAAFGYGFDSRASEGINTAHQWAEVYLPGYQTWVLVDTTWGESGPAIIGSDLNHFYKYVAVNSPLEPAPVTVEYVGSISEIPNEVFNITPAAAAVESATQTPTDLLAKYPAASATNVWNSITNNVQIIDAALTQVLRDSLGLADGVILSAAKVVVYVLIITAVAGSVIVVIKRISRLFHHVGKQQPTFKT